MKSKRANITITVLALVAFTLGVVLLTRESDRDRTSRELQRTEIPEGTVVHEVILSGEGFRPEEIEIKKGEAVRWSTGSVQFFWPASNIHPKHNIYPEFDPRDAIPSGKSWTFLFERPGEWEYHDHINPVHTGVVKVTQ